MSVRRLHAEQPESFTFTPENLAWAEKVITRYPEGRQASAVIPLLMRAQEQEGWVTKPCIEHIADMLGMPHIRVLEVATFYTQFQLAPVGTTAHVQVCGTTPCMIRGADKLIKLCKSRIAEHAFELSNDGRFSWEEVECAGACVNAPMVTIGKDTYEDLTEESFGALLDGFAAGNPPQPGPQNGRQFAAAEGGETTLLDPSLYDGSVIGKYRAYERAPEPAPAPAAPAAPAPAPAAAPAAPAVKAQGNADAEKVPDVFKPDLLLKQPREGKADDLKALPGLDPKMEEKLHALGIYHYDQVAAWTADNARWIDQTLGAEKGKALSAAWIEAAGKLAAANPASSDKDGGAPK